MPFAIRRITDVPRYVKALIYGPFGAGKTWLAASASHVPDMQSVLYIDVEGGDSTLLDFPDVDVLSVRDYDVMQDIIEYLRVHASLRDKYDAETVERLRRIESRMRGAEVAEPTRYRTIVIDSFSEMQKLVLYKLGHRQIATARLNTVPEALEIRHWGQMTEMVRLLVRTLRDLPYHVVLVMPMETITNESGFVTEYKPLFDGRKVEGDIMQFLDVLGLLTVNIDDKGALHRRLMLEPGQNYKAKGRFGHRVPFLDDPTMAMLHTLVTTR